MADSSTADLQVCIRTTLKLDRAKEDAFVNWAWQVVDKQHRDLGYGGAPNTYTFGSWLWNSLAYLNRYENDFSDRLHLPPQQGGELYKLSNRSLNFPKQFVNSYHAGATADLDAYGFLACEPEGGEDEHPALPLWERYLRTRAERLGLGKALKDDSAKPLLITGTQTVSIRRQRKVRVEKRQAKAIINVIEGHADFGKPLRDTRGQMVTELDMWDPDPLNPDRLVLRRDPSLFRAVDVPLKLSDRTYAVDHVLHESNGACVEFIHPGDFVFEQTQRDIAAMACVGHFLALPMDDLFEQFDQGAITEAGKKFRDTYGSNTSSPDEQTNANAPKLKQGEGPNSADTLIWAGSMPRRRYFCGYFRYDLDGDGRRERIFAIFDWVTRTPICYDPVSLVLESDERVSPYHILALRRKMHRAVGEGVYEQFNDLSEDADQKYNRIQLEEASSGKVVTFDPNALEQTKAGMPLKFRGPILYKKTNGQASKEEIIGVTQIPAETGEMRENLALAVQTMTARGGGITPGEAEQSALPAAQTATGLQILQQQKNKIDGSIEDDLQANHLELLRTWAVVEASAFDETLARKLFKGKTVTMPNPEFLAFQVSSSMLPPVGGPVPPETSNQAPETAPAPVMAPAPPPETIEVDAFTVLQDWLKATPPEDLRNVVKLVLAKSKEAEVASRADNRVKLIQQYSVMPPLLQQALESEFIELLTLNGSQNAEKTVKDIQAATLAMPPPLPPGAEGAGSDLEELPPGDEQVPTGRPEFNKNIGVQPPPEPGI